MNKISRRTLCKSAAGLSAAAGLLGYTGLAKGQEQKSKRGDAGGNEPQSQVLAARAKDCLEQVLEVARGPGGLLISHSRFDTRLPLQEDDHLEPYLRQELDSVWGKDAPKPSVADWYYGENTLWSTGWFLWSQMIRYRLTGEAEALSLARKCFQDISHVFNLCRAIEPGLLGKPHGGRAGATTSFDQSANPVLFYVQFAREFGAPAEREEARKNMLDHGDYYLRRNWMVNHHGNLSRIVPVGHPSAMKYFAAVHAAYDMTGEERFRDAAVKYVREILQKGLLPWPSARYDLNANLLYYAWLSEYWSQTSLAKDFDWIGNIKIYWEAAQKGLDEEGLLLDGMYDSKKKEFTPVKEGWSDQNPPSEGNKPTLRWWRSPTGYEGRTFYSLLIAVLGFLARKHGLDDHAHEVSRKILLRADRSTFRQCFDDGRLPAEIQPVANLFCAEYPAEWLIGYWMGREQRVW